MRRKFLLWLGGAFSLLFACEFALHVLPVPTSTATGYYLDPLILTYPPHHSWTAATGWDLRNWQRHRANNAGFLADRDFERNPEAIALIGDSFVEASMLPSGERPAAQLERALGGRPVFALGGPGSALLDYAERIRFVTEHYAVRDVVILMERGDIRQSMCGSGNIHGPCIDSGTLAPRTETQSPPGLAKRVLRHSALAQYLFGQLRLQPEKLWRQAILQSRPVVEDSLVVGNQADKYPVKNSVSSAGLDVVAAAFFERIKGRIPGRLVIVIDSDRAALYRGQLVNDPERERFIAQALEHGAKVVNTEPLFLAEFSRQTLKFDVGPYDAHLNRLGVAIAMNAAASQLLLP